MEKGLKNTHAGHAKNGEHLRGPKEMSIREQRELTICLLCSLADSLRDAVDAGPYPPRSRPKKVRAVKALADLLC
jgi:hypothetical protein